MLVQGHAGRAQAAEHKAAIGVNPRHPTQPEVFFAKRRVVAVLVGHAGQLAVTAKRPAVIGAAKGARIAPLGLTHGVGPMRAAVHQQLDLPRVIADHDDRLTANPGHPKVARLRDFAGMADVHPAAMKNCGQLFLKDVGVGIHPAVNPVVFDQRLIVDGRLPCCHSPSHMSRV